MKLYFEGIISSNDQSFMPTVLWFARPDDDDFDFCVSQDRIALEGEFIECGVKDGEFSGRWKGVDLVYLKELDGEFIFEDTDKFTLDEFAKMIKDKGLHLVSLDGYFSENADVKFTEISILDGNDWYRLDEELIDEIELIV